MTESRNGPPLNESRPPAKRAASETAADADSIPRGRRLYWVPCTRVFPQDRSSQLRRRRDASYRLPVLNCGCPDPWPCRCSDPLLSSNMVDAGRDAALHLLKSGAVPVLKFEVLQALWRRGGADRELAERVWDETGGLVA